MKVTIECETPFETRRALGGTDAWLVLWKLADAMRKMEDNDNVSQAFQIVTLHWRTFLDALCDDYRVDLDDDEEVTP